jgi:hypothetical protein
MKTELQGFGNQHQRYTQVYQGDKMRNFNYDENEDFREDIDKFFEQDGESGDNYDDFLKEEFAIQEAKIALQSRDINLRLMRTAVRVCEKTFLWSFYSIPTRLKMISETYKKLRKLEE